MLLLMPCVAIAATDNNISSSQITDVVEQRPHGKATDSNIFGHVLVSATGEHLPYATVVVKGTTYGCAADGTGHYNINNIPLGDHVLVLSAIG